MKRIEIAEKAISKIGENIDWRTNYAFFELKQGVDINLIRGLSRIGKLSLIDETTLNNEELIHEVKNDFVEVAKPHYESTDCWCGPRDENDYEWKNIEELENIYFDYVYFKLS